MTTIPKISSTVVMAFALMTIIAMMVLPMPSWMLDLGLAVSFGVAILIFTVTIFIERPLDFSSFPTVLLTALILRLSLNISSTKLIIGEGHTGPNAAGDVIFGFSQFIMSGNLVIGIVVFCVLMIVNFAVITKGSARMAEVSARFALDAMPGKQLAIDSDMSAGAINHTEAKVRREHEQQETTFFGSLDGASKFVKGDAIAGLLIIGLNLIVGIAVGTFSHGMSLADALETYSILTVGDGLVSQIPAVIISIATGLLLAKGGNDESSDVTITSQLTKYPSAMATVAVLMALFAVLPGLPFLPFILGSSVLGVSAWYVSNFRPPEPEDIEILDSDTEKVNKPSLGDILDLDEIHVEFATDLVNMVLDPGTGLDLRVENMRSHIATTFGLILPEVRLTDAPSLATGLYIIRIQGVEIARGQLNPEMVLALLPQEQNSLPPGKDVSEPVYGAPARWIHPNKQEQASISGATIVTPTEVIATHLLEVIKKNLGRLFTTKSLRRLLDEMVTLSNTKRAESNRKLFDELIPDKVPTDILLQVLKLLLDEQVSIRNLPLIIEVISENYKKVLQPEALCEYVRQKLGFQIVSTIRRDDGTIPLLQLSPEWEEIFQSHQVDGGTMGLDVALPPEDFDRLGKNLTDSLLEALERGQNPGIVTTSKRRRFIRTVTLSRGQNSPVLSFDEIGIESKPSLVGIIRF